MAGPTTEVLNEDVKSLRDEIRGSRDEIHQVDKDVAKLQTEFSLAKWLIGLTLVASLSGIGTGIWWGATITADVKNLGARMDERFKQVDGRFDKIDSRFDRLEASIVKLADQVKSFGKPLQ